MKKIKAGLAVASAIVVSGCGLGSPDAPASSAPASDPPASSAPTTAPAPSASAPSASAAAPAGPSTAPTAGGAPPAGPDQLGTPVATRKSSKDGEEIVVTLYPVVRDGGVSHLNFTLASAAAPNKKVQIDSLLSDSDSATGDKGGWAADGLQLIDGKNNKVYLTASDGRGQCLCSRQLIGVYLQDNLPLALSATFAAPPADVSTVDVRVPSFGTVVRVPVS